MNLQSSLDDSFRSLVNVVVRTIKIQFSHSIINHKVQIEINIIST